MVKEATTNDSRVLAEMAIQMWDSHSVEELETEFIETLKNKQSACSDPFYIFSAPLRAKAK